MATQVRVFGSLEITVDGRRLTARDFGGRKPKQLLEILVLHGGTFVAKDRLAELLWADALPVSVAGSLEHYVSLIRRRLSPQGARGASVIVTDHGGYRFDTTAAWVDLAEFSRLADAATASTGAAVIEQALAVVTGDLFEDEPYCDWALAARSENRLRRLRLHVSAGELALARDDTGCAATHARAALALDNLHEGAVRLLMTASYRCGEQSEALRAFGEFRAALAQDVGADPMPQTSDLHEAVLRHAVTVPAGRAIEMSDPRSVVRLVPGQRTPSAPVQLGCARTGPVLLGRDQDVQACLSLHAAAQRGRPGLKVAVIVGELGIGKSALLDELARRLPRAQLIRVACTEQTRTVAGFVLEQILGAALGDLTPAAQAVLDELTVEGPAQGAIPLSGLRTLDRLLAPSPLTVLVDDAHLADERSLQVLAALVRRPGGGAGTVVLAADVARVALGHGLRVFPAAVTVTLSPLGAEDLLALGVPGLLEPTGGLPLLVASVAAGAVDAATSHRVLSALQSGDELTWRVVTACAMAATRFGTTEVARLVGADDLLVAEVQERLCEQHVLVEVHDGYRFRYPLVRDVVRAAVSGGRRRLLQRRLRAEDDGPDRRWHANPPPGGDRRCGPDRRAPTQSPRLRRREGVQ